LLTVLALSGTWICLDRRRDAERPWSSRRLG
jgi:hypothetical protein